MKRNLNPSNIFSTYDLINFFFDEKDDKRILRPDETINPLLLFVLKKIFDFDFEIEYHMHEPVCPKCGSRLNRNSSNEVNINKCLPVKKKRYKCSNEECDFSDETSLERFIKKHCTYTHDMNKLIAKLQLEGHESYEKIGNKLGVIFGHSMPKSTAYHFFDQHIDKELDKKEKQYEVMESEVKGHDETFGKVNGENVVIPVAIDPVTLKPIKFDIIKGKGFKKENCEDFIDDLINISNPKHIVTDGARMYDNIMDERGIKHQKCHFHNLNTIYKTVPNKIDTLKEDVEGIEKTINTNKKDINKFKEKNKGKSGRCAKQDYERKFNITDRKNLERKNSKLLQEQRELNSKIRANEDFLEKSKKMLESKSIKAARNRFNRLKKNTDDLFDDCKKFIRSIERNFDKLFHHLKNPNVPRTNNANEIYNKYILGNGHKKRFKTEKGLKRHIRNRQIKWIERVVPKKYKKPIN